MPYHPNPEAFEMRRLMMMTLAVGAVAVAVAACSGGSKTKSRGDEVDLPGDSWFPESLNADASGTLYVGSIAHGEIAKNGLHETTPTLFVTTAASGLAGITGVLVDDATHTLYACAVDLSFATPSKVIAFDLATGAQTNAWTFPNPFAVCNDIAIDGSGKVYASDSTGGMIDRIPASGTTLDVWKQDVTLAAAGTAGIASFGVDGLAWDGTDLYANNLSKHSLVRIPIVAGDSAGTPVPIDVTPPFSGPDGMRLDGAGTLLVVDGFVGQLNRVVVTGTTATSTTLESGLDGPTSVVRTSDGLWVTEGQLAILLGLQAGPPNLPFKVRRFDH
jgi:hypothetical protein